MPAKRHTSLFLWRAGALVIGPAIDSRLHSHHALQLSFGLDRPFRVRFSADEKWSETRAALLSPSQPHQIDGGGMLAHLFLELPQRKGTIASKLHADFSSDARFAEVQNFLQLASEIPGTGVDIEPATAAARQWRACALGEQQLASYDARIKLALDAIAAQPGSAVTGSHLARLCHLSESRFTHLFCQQTGMPLSRYQLWTKLLSAIDTVAGGGNMTDAAHAAGFSDLAHMSRTFSRTFGVVPSELQKMTIAFKRENL